MKLKLFKGIENYIKKQEELKNIKRNKEKQDVISLVTRSWTKEEVDIYNNCIYICSLPSFCGTESNIKYSILYRNRHLFSEQELNDLNELIGITKN